jgi:hypothetical protein
VLQRLEALIDDEKNDAATLLYQTRSLLASASGADLKRPFGWMNEDNVSNGCENESDPETLYRREG